MIVPMTAAAAAAVYFGMRVSWRKNAKVWKPLYRTVSSRVGAMNFTLISTITLFRCTRTCSSSPCVSVLQVYSQCEKKKRRILLTAFILSVDANYGPMCV